MVKSLIDNEATLYSVATPIGNLGDISQRALDVLREVDLIAAEDTRHSKKLLQHFGISTKMISLHAHNERESSRGLLKLLQEGKSIAIISDAGTPLISDPGFELVRLAHENNISVVPIPGSCAAIAALSASGLPCHEFLFVGFLPAKAVARKKQLERLKNESRTVIFYESPHRIMAMLDDFLAVFDEKRLIVIAREITKKFETIKRGELKKMIVWMQQYKEQQRGEFVVLIEGIEQQSNQAEAKRVLRILLEELPAKQAASLTAKITGERKNFLYDLAINRL